MRVSRVSLAVMFALGCAAGPAISAFVVRPAHAVPANVQKWTQFCAPYGGHGYLDAADIAGAINPDIKNRGLEGWELVSAVPIAAGGGYTGSALYCFRQPLQWSTATRPCAAAATTSARTGRCSCA